MARKGVQDRAQRRRSRQAAEAVEAELYWQGPYYARDLLSAEEAEGAAPGAASGSVSPRARQLYAAESMYYKDRVAAALFAFFLGAFGVHKFYLGCNRAGFSMLGLTIIGGLLTFGVAVIVSQAIAMMEGVIYLSRSQTQFQRIYVASQRDWF